MGIDWGPSNGIGSGVPSSDSPRRTPGAGRESWADAAAAPRVVPREGNRGYPPQVPSKGDLSFVFGPTARSFPRVACTMAKSLEVRVPHALDQDEIKRRLDEALVRARSDYADSVGEITAQWAGEDRMQFNLAVAGMKFDGSLEILIEELLVKLELPGAAALFSGRIREGIQERLGGLVG